MDKFLIKAAFENEALKEGRRLFESRRLKEEMQ